MEASWELTTTRLSWRIRRSSSKQQRPCSNSPYKSDNFLANRVPTAMGFSTTNPRVFRGSKKNIHHFMSPGEFRVFVGGTFFQTMNKNEPEDDFRRKMLSNKLFVTVVFDPSVSNSCIDCVSKHSQKSILNDYTMINRSIWHSCRQHCIFLRNKYGLAATGKVEYAVRLQQLNEEVQF